MPLTQKQELYCQARARGLSQRAAYREAYPSALRWKDGSVDNKASALERNAQVAARLARLNDEAAKAAKLTRAKLLARLDNVAAEAERRLLAPGPDGGDYLNADNAKVVINATRELLPYAADDGQGEPARFVADFGLLVAPDFLEAHRAIAGGAETDIWLEGGRGSMKSSFASLEVVNYIERNPDRHALVLMKHKANLRDAAYAQVAWAIRALGLEDDYDLPDSTLRIRKRSTGQLIIFRGCDNASKIKSVKVPFGYIGVAWYEEADMFGGMAEIRKVNQSMTRGGREFVRIYSFNPPRSRSCWVNEEMQRRRDEGRPVYTSNYLNAPREWLGGQFFADAEELKRTDPQAYEHEYMGLPVGNGTEVFDRVVYREITDEEIAAFDNLRCGQDFGWYPDPWAFAVSEWRPAQRTVLSFMERGGNKLQPNEQAELIMAALTWRDEGAAEPTYHHLRVRSDDADPTAIAAQRDTGANAVAACKGGMRTASYRFLQSVTWVIDPARCPRLAKEVRGKQYEVSGTGEVLNSIPDGNDHWIDAVRYAFMGEARRRDAYRSGTEGA